MKRPRHRPLDLSAASLSEPAAVEAAPEAALEPISEAEAAPVVDEAPHAEELQPLDLHLAPNLGAMVAAEDRTLEAPDEHDKTIDLPPLRLNPEPSSPVEEDPRGLPIYVAAAVVSCLWALAPIMFAWGYQRGVTPFENDLFAFSVLALMAVGPVALVWISAFLFHQGARLAAQTRRTQALADNLAQPAAMAAHGVGSAVDLVRQEIVQATAATQQARTELLALRDVLAAESERLVEAAAGSSRSAAHLTLELGAEREKMSLLAGQLDSQATHVTDAIGQHARMVAEASDLAETQIREAEAALAARAADLAAAAGEASDAARIAGEDLSRQVARLETASLGVGDQVRVVEEGLTEQRAALVAAAHGMRADHEAFSTEAETQRAQLTEVMVHARSGASELAETSERSAEALRQLIAAATDQLREMSDSTAEERDLFSAAAAQSLGAISEIAVRQREAIELQTREAIDALSQAAEEARGAAEEHGQIVREKVDQLGEAAFSAGQKADAAFEARLDQARAMIEQSAQLVVDAGERSNTRLGEGVEAARGALSELEGLLSEIDARVARLPEAAQAQAEAVRESIGRNMEDLMASARRAAEETQSIDAAFQDRVRRNYDMLSEAVRLMGVVAGGASSARAAAPRPAPPPLAPPVTPRDPADSPARARRDEAPADELLQPTGLRPRLRLTPTASDEEFRTVFGSASGIDAPEPAATPPAGAGAGDSWTWKELLSSMDEGMGEGLGDDKSLADTLLAEIATMGIDAGALLPRTRIDQIAAAIQAGEPSAGREIVRRLAPAAVRRLARRMMSDRGFRGQADRYVRRYESMIKDTAGEGQNFVAAALLGSDQGRAYLLFDAALSDAG
jgi:hypothetical protein